MSKAFTRMVQSSEKNLNPPGLIAFREILLGGLAVTKTAFEGVVVKKVPSFQIGYNRHTLLGEKSIKETSHTPNSDR